MSTRSGKRIHGSLHETTVDDITEVKSERKTRSKHQKENCNELVTKKQRKNFVRYPSEEDIAPDVEKVLRSTRKSQRNTLKEQNIANDSENSNDDKNTRRTRRTKVIESRVTENFEPNNEVKVKGKNNRKTQVLTDENLSEPIMHKKKSNKKKRKRTSGSLIVEDIIQTDNARNNTSSMSIDSFHSAAGGSVTDDIVEKNQEYTNILLKDNKILEGQKEVCNQIEDISPEAIAVQNIHTEENLHVKNNKIKKKKRKLSNDKAFNGSLNTRSNDEIVNNSLEVNMNEPTNQTQDHQQQQKNRDSSSKSPGLKNSLLNSSKKRRTKTISTDDKLENENETVHMKTLYHINNNINTPDQLQKLDVTDERSANKNSTHKRINKSGSNLNATFDRDITDSVHQHEQIQNISSNIDSTKKKRKSTFDVLNMSGNNFNSTFVKESSMINKPDNLNDLLINETKNKRKSRNTKSTCDESDNISIINLDATYEKKNSSQTQKTIETNKKVNKTDKSQNISKYSLDPDVPKSLNVTFDNIFLTESQPNCRNNSTFDKSTKLNATFEIVKNTKFNATFDKSQSIGPRRSSSLISSDTTDASRISITSDESMAENIANISTVLIESSMDESQINISSNKNKDMKVAATAKHAALQTQQQNGFDDNKDVKLKETNIIKTDLNIPSGSEVVLTDIKDTPLKCDKTYTELNYGTPPKGTAAVSSPKTPKTKTFSEKAEANTPRDKGTCEGYAVSKTPLKREGTYTELNPSTTPHKKDAIAKNESKTPIKSDKLFKDETATPTLKREGTFTKEDSDVKEFPSKTLDVCKTPTRRKSLPSPGRTPFVITSKPVSKDTSKEKIMLNITRSIEKSNRRSSVELPRATRVMFCSPVDTPAVLNQMNGRVIKSNLKGSDKSFVFDDSTRAARPGRKRSHTQGASDGGGAKRARTASAAGKLQDPGTPSKRTASLGKPKAEVTPSKTAKVSRTKLPNFAALHQKRFAQMESLDECQRRRAQRARQLLTPTGSGSLLDRISPKETQPAPPPPAATAQPKKTETPKKRASAPAHHKHAYTRFGFKLNHDANASGFRVKIDARPKEEDGDPFSFAAKAETKGTKGAGGAGNPFSFPAKGVGEAKRHQDPFSFPAKGLGEARRSGALPSLAGATARRQLAQQTVLREKSFSDKRDSSRRENRTVIRGVRTNRRFELQMKMRNV